MAQKFRKVDPRIWTDEGFSKLNPEAKLLALWLLTSLRINRCGIVLWSGALASEETGIQAHCVDEVLDTVCDTLSWVADKTSKVVFLTRWWRYNRPDNESALKGAMADLWDVPRNRLKPHLQKACDYLPKEFHTVYRSVLDTVYRSVLDTVYYTVSSQEKDLDQKKETSLPASASEERKPKKDKRKPAKPRPRNELFDAVAEVTGHDPVTSGPLIGKVSAALSTLNPPATPDEIRDFGRRFWELCDWARDKRPKPEPGELQKHFPKIRAAKIISKSCTGIIDWDAGPTAKEIEVRDRLAAEAKQQRAIAE